MSFRILVLLGGAIATAIAGAIYPFVGLLALEFLTFGRPQDDRPNVEVLHIPLIIVVSIILGLLPRIGTYGPGLIAGLKRIWLMLALYAVLLGSALANGWTILSRNRLYDFGTIVFLCLVTLAIVNSVKRLHVFLWMLLACGLYVAERVIRNPGDIFERIGSEQYERAAIARGARKFRQQQFSGTPDGALDVFGDPVDGCVQKMVATDSVAGDCCGVRICFLPRELARRVHGAGCGAAVDVDYQREKSARNRRGDGGRTHSSDRRAGRVLVPTGYDPHVSGGRFGDYAA